MVHGTIPSRGTRGCGLAGFGASELLEMLRNQLAPLINQWGQQQISLINSSFDNYTGQLQTILNQLRAKMQEINAASANLNSAQALLQSGQFTQLDNVRNDINNMLAASVDDIKKYVDQKVEEAKSNTVAISKPSSIFKFQ